MGTVNLEQNAETHEFCCGTQSRMNKRFFIFSSQRNDHGPVVAVGEQNTAAVALQLPSTLGNFNVANSNVERRTRRKSSQRTIVVHKDKRGPKTKRRNGGPGFCLKVSTKYFLGSRSVPHHERPDLGCENVVVRRHKLVNSVFV